MLLKAMTTKSYETAIKPQPKTNISVNERSKFCMHQNYSTVNFFRVYLVMTKNYLIRFWPELLNRTNAEVKQTKHENAFSLKQELLHISHFSTNKHRRTIEGQPTYCWSLSSRTGGRTSGWRVEGTDKRTDDCMDRWLTSNWPVVVPCIQGFLCK